MKNKKNKATALSTPAVILLLLLCVSCLTFVRHTVYSEEIEYSIVVSDFPYSSDRFRNRFLENGISAQEFDAYLGYRTLSVGSRGAEVARLKERMFELGYFQNRTSNDTYTETTAEYVKEFQRVNGLPETGSMTPFMQLWFYSSYAAPKPKPVEYVRYGYKDVARNAANLIGLTWKCTVYVIQQIDVPKSSDIYLLLYVDRKPEQLLYAYVPGFKDFTFGGVFNNTGINRLLENDKMDIECVVLGEYTYTTVQDIQRTVPYVEVKKVWLYE